MVLCHPGLVRGERGARQSRAGVVRDSIARTVLDEDIQALLDEQVGIENDEAERQRQHIVAGALAEELSDCFL